MKELIIQNLWFIVAAVLWVLSGIYIVQSKAYHLIPGYNTMTPEKKKKVNIEMVAIAVRNAFILLGILLIIIPIITEFLNMNQLKIELLVVGHLIVICTFGIIIFTGKKYKISR